MRYLDVEEEVFSPCVLPIFMFGGGVWTVELLDIFANRLVDRAAQGAHLTHRNAPAGISDELKECTPDVMIGKGFFRARCAGLP